MTETLLVIYTDGRSEAVSVAPTHAPEAARDLLLDRTVAAVIHLTRLHQCPQDPHTRDLPLHRGPLEVMFPPIFHLLSTDFSSRGEYNKIDQQILAELREIKTILMLTLEEQRQLIVWLVLAVIGSALGSRFLEWLMRRINNRGS